nr:immunoglobulin heavy chain junction region [Macaca mulatta]MOW99882.1 immunoglobulin heavy chain junction region [Macaca mulatta]MOX00765.1 immunoglobulin heavy chain junction region [Macaca mulatta]MOX00876.1 immunoglobulin heavy chain junction region [Macaca mulatta]MOX01123.1 immunoglobulin heavy chain junction region [Macaca mulatta]
CTRGGDYADDYGYYQTPYFDSW